MKKLVLLIGVAAVAAALMALPATTGEWHTGQNNLCTDCHTMHFSQAHEWGSADPIGTTPTLDGNWLSATGPNHFLLKAPVNDLCLQCHDGSGIAPDVLGENFNGPTENRSAGALNRTGVASPYDSWKGHTLDSTVTPPGFNPAAVGVAPASQYQPAGGLECISCHTQHGIAGVYRNLGPRAVGTANLPSYAIGTNDPTKDVFINVTAPYVPNTGIAATFNPYYATGNVSYNRGDKTVGLTKTSNGIDTQCATCHGDFHGGVGDAGIAGTVGIGEFERHPTAQITIGSIGGGHSELARYTGATTKVKVYADDTTAFTDATPGCVSCHKAHGNQNPFGLIFLNRAAASVTEQGGYAAGQVEKANGYQLGYANLCGQCHRQGQ